MKTVLEYGAEINTLDSGEMEAILARQAQDWFRNYARGVKYLRFPPHGAQVTNSAVSYDGSIDANAGPREGYVWSIRRLTAWGLSNGASPDVINLYRNQAQGIPIWQFNGNNFAYTFGKTELLLLPGETLSFANSGTITAATGTLITISGDLIECPAEEIFKVI